MEPWLPETPPRRKGDITLSFFRFLPFSEFTELIAADKPLSKISTALQTCQFTLFIPPALYFDRLAYSPNPAGRLSLPLLCNSSFSKNTGEIAQPTLSLVPNITDGSEAGSQSS